MRTFDIKSEMYALRDLLEQPFEVDEGTGEVIDNTEAVEELAKALDVEIDDKLDGIEYIKREFKAVEESLASEIKRLQERKKMMGRKQEQLKHLQDLILSGEKRKTDRFTFSYSARKSVNIFDESKIPAQFIKFEPKIDKTELSKAVKAGEDIDGAELVENITLAVR